MAKKRKSKTKRTITPEHLAAMQAGRKKAKVHRERVASVEDLGKTVHMAESKTDKILQSVARRK